jgi:hypothetical protein
MDEKSFDAARTRSLTAGRPPRGYVLPQRTGIVPRNAPAAPKGSGRALNMSVGYKLSAAQAEEAGLMVEVKDFATGYTRKQVEDWLKGPAGRKWAGDSLCIVFYSAAESLAA